ncbi:MAG: efflux RND transporter periplasmic adaptor subunit [Bacteroidota bacterium]|nr:efflux RND transporter periplasmic adaptor subunit [Bacteroidota bacterium]
MKKILITALSILMIYGCRDQQRTTGTVQKEIFQTKQHLANLEDEYAKLLSQDSAKEIGIKVRVIDVKVKNIEHEFTVTGSAEADKIAYVTPETNGQIKKIYVREGGYVKKGQLLIGLNSAVLRNSIREVKKGLELAKIMYEKQKRLAEECVGKEVDLLQAKNSKESLEAKLQTLNSQLEMSQIRAPFSGIVDKIIGKEGEMASPGMRIIQLVNLTNMSVTVNVSEKYISLLKKGQKAKLTFTAYPEMEINAKVSRIGNVINPVNRTFEVEVNFKNRARKIKPNMIARMHLSDYSGKGIAIPSNLILNDKKGKYVYVAVQDGENYSARKKYIQTGYTLGADLVVIGLVENDLVIAEGLNFVSNEIKLRIVK